VAPEVRLVGEQTREDRPGCQFKTVTAPDVADMVSGAPFAKAAVVLPITMGTVEPLVTGERVTVTVATTPLPIVESFMPSVRHVTDPLAELQVRLQPAAVSTGPAATAMLASVGTNENVHCRPAGAPLPPNERLRDVEPPSTAEPDERLKETV
jgi:hypothetical protein